MTSQSSLIADQNDGWIEHDGKGIPVDGGIQVKVRQRDGWVSGAYVNASYWSVSHDNWTHGGKRKMYDIVAYRIHSPSPPRALSKEESNG